LLSQDSESQCPPIILHLFIPASALYYSHRLGLEHYKCSTFYPLKDALSLRDNVEACESHTRNKEKDPEFILLSRRCTSSSQQHCTVGKKSL